MLDLFPPYVIAQSFEYLVGLDEDPAEDWEPRHINAAEQLCKLHANDTPTRRRSITGETLTETPTYRGGVSFFLSFKRAGFSQTTC